MAVKELTLFDYLRDIITHKRGDLHLRDEFKKSFVPFIIIRFLSMRSDLLPYAEIANRYQGVFTAEQMYLFLVNTVPYNKSSYIKYIKKPKTDEEETE